MSRRFFVPELASGEFQILTGGEARHVRQVLRKVAGDRVVMFDGAGNEAEGIITERREEDTATGELVLRIVSRREVSYELGILLVIATAVPKGDRLKWMVEKLTELGVTRYVPLLTERSVVDPREGKLERLKQTVIEASKQCGRTKLMEIGEVTPWEEFVREEIGKGRVWVGDRSGRGMAEIQGDEIAGSCTVAIGPEGGFTERELQMATGAGAELLRLGHRILRIETAAISAASLLGVGREE